MKKMTKWFLEHIKPERVGVYEVQWWCFDCWEYGFSYWDGKEWTNSCETPKSAFLHKKWVNGATQEKKWRGFTEEQK